eukprot:gene1676-1830_t
MSNCLRSETVIIYQAHTTTPSSSSKEDTTSTRTKDKTQTRKPEKESKDNWEIGLFEIGDCCLCLYSFTCCSCAAASARSALDGSSWCVNTTCLSSALLRWLVRTAYDIEGDAHDDCWKGLCCPCCVINQALQTATKRGRPPIPEVGPEFNVNPRIAFQRRPCAELTYDACYALICWPCTAGLVAETVGMPFWFGACCASGFAMNSVMRYHYRIRPFMDNEWILDCMLPSLLISLNCITMYVTYPLAEWGFAFASLSETNARVNRHGCYGCGCCTTCSYLSDYIFTCTCTAREGRYLDRTNIDAVSGH